MNDKVNYRTCVCCRSLMHKSNMVRIATVEGKSFVDKTYKAGGRGFYICSEECLNKILTSRKFTRYSGTISTDAMITEIKDVLSDAE